MLIVLSKKGELFPSFQFSTGELLNGLQTTFKVRLLNGLFVLRVAVLFLIIIALSRPQLMLEETKQEAEGIDIVLAVDTSTSMLAEDFELKGNRANRLEVVKDVVKNFINNRSFDRIGVVAFASSAYTI